MKLLSDTEKIERAVRMAGNMRKSEITEEEYRNVKRLFVSELEGENLSGLGFENMAELQDLTFRQCFSLNDISLLSELTKLKRLIFYHCPKVANISSLAQNRNLEILEIDNASVTDLSPLMNLPRLRRINLSRVDITKEGIRNLQRSIPQCHIHHDAKS